MRTAIALILLATPALAQEAAWPREFLSIIEEDKTNCTGEPSVAPLPTPTCAALMGAEISAHLHQRKTEGRRKEDARKTDNLLEYQGVNSVFLPKGES